MTKIIPVKAKGFLHYKKDNLTVLEIDEINAMAGSISKNHNEKLRKLSGDEKCKYVSETHEFGIAVTKTGKATVSSMTRRLCDKKWWRRQLIRKADEHREHLAHISKALGRDTEQQCCTDETVRIMHQRMVSVRRMMDNSFKIITSTIGSERPVYFSMGELDKKKRAARLNEVFMDVKALESIAKMYGWRWSFVTLIAPSQYHSNPAEGVNSYDFTLTANMANTAIAKDWKSIRDYLKERLFFPWEHYFGIRVTEVHEDGCPHWHILIFHHDSVLEHIYAAVERIFEKRSKEWYFEKFKDKIIMVGKSEKAGETGVAAASSYIFGYLKFALHCDDSDEPNYSIANKYKCAIKAMKVRQYQFFGVKNSKGKLRALAQVRGKAGVPESIKEMAEEMFVRALPEGGDQAFEVSRRERQLAARIKFYLGDADLLSFEREKYINVYGEEVERVLSIKHAGDSEAVQIGGLCEDISKPELDALLASDDTK